MDSSVSKHCISDDINVKNCNSSSKIHPKMFPRILVMPLIDLGGREFPVFLVVGVLTFMFRKSRLSLPVALGGDVFVLSMPMCVV